MDKGLLRFDLAIGAGAGAGGRYRLSLVLGLDTQAAVRARRLLRQRRSFALCIMRVFMFRNGRAGAGHVEWWRSR